MNNSKVQIISALVWAITMLIVSYLMKDSGKSDTIALILLMGSNFHFLLLADLGKKRREKSSCVKANSSNT